MPNFRDFKISAMLKQVNFILIKATIEQSIYVFKVTKHLLEYMIFIKYVNIPKTSNFW